MITNRFLFLIAVISLLCLKQLPAHAQTQDQANSDGTYWMCIATGLDVDYESQQIWSKITRSRSEAETSALNICRSVAEPAALSRRKSAWHPLDELALLDLLDDDFFDDLRIA